MREDAARQAVVEAGRSLFDRGLTPGSTGNLSVRCGTGWLVTPTGASLGRLGIDALSLLGGQGDLLAGLAPTKEVPLHLAMYRSQPEINAVVHLHSPFAVAVSIMADVDPADVLPPLTAYYVMRVGRLPLVPYFPPGDPGLGDAVMRYASDSTCCLLANHGPVASARSLEAALDAVEEIEQTARIWLQLRGLPARHLRQEQILELRRGAHTSASSTGAKETT